MTEQVVVHKAGLTEVASVVVSASVAVSAVVSASERTTSRLLTSLAPLPLPTEAPRSADLPFARQVSTVREMLSSLETFTVAGQHHVMDKIVAFIRDRVRLVRQRAGATGDDVVGSRSDVALIDLVRTLEEATEPVRPDVGAFRRHAEAALTALLAVA